MKCVRPNCKNQVPSGVFMCPLHWNEIPAEIKKLIFDCYHLSTLFWFNFLVCQWLFFRVCKWTNKDLTVITGWGILFPIVPLTGWWSSYIPKKFKQARLLDMEKIKG